MPSNKWFRFIFPIKKEEFRTFFLLGSLMFFIIFNNTMVRNLKDCFIVMNNGALSIAFIKLWGVLPATFMALVVFAKVSNHMKQENVYYFFVSIFIVFFALFGFVILPNHNTVSLHFFGDWLRQYLPYNLKELIGLIEYWDYSLFFIFSELWSSIVVSLLFWQFANAVVLKEDAKRFYPLFGIIADVGMILAGIALVYITQEQEALLSTISNWQQNMQSMTWLILLSGLCSMALYYLANRYFEKSQKQELQTQQKTHLSMPESVRFLGKSQNMRYLALMVLGFAISSNLIEIAWKCQIEKACNSMTQFTNIMGYLSIITGISTILLVFIGGNLLRAKGWLFGALMPALFMFIVGSIFFGLLIIENNFFIPSIFGYSTTFLITFVGSLENILGKSVKFSLFDPTKEMVFIPLDLESKLKGKAAIDMFGVRLGKSIGSMFHQGIAVTFGSFQGALSVYFITFALVVGIWIYSIKNLYEKQVKQHAF